MRKLIQKFWLVRRVFKLCPFTLFIFISAFTACLGYARFVGYTFALTDDGMAGYYVLFLVGITILSVCALKFTIKIRTYSCALMPFVAVCFSIILFECMDTTREIVIFLSGVTLLCAVVLSFFCGKKGFIRTVSLLGAIAIAVLAFGGSYIFKDFTFYPDEVLHIVASPDRKHEAVVKRSADGETVRINVRNRTTDMYVIIGTFRKINGERVFDDSYNNLQHVSWTDEFTLSINDKQIEIAK